MEELARWPTPESAPLFLVMRKAPLLAREDDRKKWVDVEPERTPERLLEAERQHRKLDQARHTLPDRLGRMFKSYSGSVARGATL